jgi:hypothetical protein
MKELKAQSGKNEVQSMGIGFDQKFGGGAGFMHLPSTQQYLNSTKTVEVQTKGLEVKSGTNEVQTIRTGSYQNMKVGVLETWIS